MKLNNKGITLTEIIISIALIAIVLVFLASLLVTVNDINDESETNSTYLINKSLILKSIENDLRKANDLKIYTCDVENFYSSYNDYKDVLSDNQKANFCYKFNFKMAEKLYDSYLGIYYYKSDKRESYVISYIRKDDTGDTLKVTKELPDFEKNNVDGSSFKKSIVWNNDPEVTKPTDGITGFFTMTIPILGDDGKDYSIIISYYK